MNPIRQSIIEAALDLEAWQREWPHSVLTVPLRDAVWAELSAMVAADPQLENADQGKLLDLFARLTEWRRVHLSAGRIAGGVWRTIETHLMYQRILTPAIDCCSMLEIAYLQGGEGDGVDWSDLDSAREQSIATMKVLGLKGFSVSMDTGETVVTLATSEMRAKEIAGHTSPGASPVGAEALSPYDEDDAPVAVPGGPRP